MTEEQRIDAAHAAIYAAGRRLTVAIATHNEARQIEAQTDYDAAQAALTKLMAELRGEGGE